ncbi:hypothetical protein [Leptolyngbya ohadii]|uniref:hypothetical protein n=1 Tax=Leptolyngbya ohadii TaxID=1962290 RepID=UPI000B59CDB0|nr:hypothetical protein [Leptolyngbya ohadii]
MPTSSPNLAAEKECLLQHIEAIRKTGQVAPALYFVSIAPTVSKGKTYHYARLLKEKNGKQSMVARLGRENSSKHQDWRRRIARREAIVELEQQLKLLDELMQRQQERSHLVDRDFGEPEE